MLTALNIGLLLFSYLLGSLSTAIILCKIMGLPDPRSQGSGNPGATNILRMTRRGPAVIVLLGDMLKGLLPVLLAQALNASSTVLAGVALAAFLGHLYPIFFGLRGGKGVATSLGVLLGLSWQAGLACIATWLIGAGLTRFSSLAALCAAIMAPLYMYWLGFPPAYQIVAGIMTVMLIWRHRSNIQNLLQGRESKINADD
jgi:glycerol-3-phosphate acyltransferase PlsY